MNVEHKKNKHPNFGNVHTGATLYATRTRQISAATAASIEESTMAASHCLYEYIHHQQAAAAAVQ